MKEIFSFIWDTAWHTPWWVYLILIYAIFIGIKASKTQVIPIKRIFIIPIILIIFSLHDLFVAVQPTFSNSATWLGSVLLGLIVGYWQIFRLPLKVDKKHHLILAPGSWSTLVVILIIFATKYYFGYQLAVDPARSHDTDFEVSLLAVSGICTGYFLGRLICYLYRLYNDPQVDLKLSIDTSKD